MTFANAERPSEVMSKGAVLLLAFVFAGCLAASPSDGTITLPTVAVGGCRDVGLRDAALTGDANDPRVAWVVQNGLRLDVVFPAGYRARFAPELEILDTDGKVVARGGDPIGGGCTTGSDARGPLLILWPPSPVAT